MNVIIRADASTHIGIGHVQRCLTLADALCRRGDIISFICCELPGNACELVESKGYRVYRLPFTETVSANQINSQNGKQLGVDWEVDAKQVKDILGKQEKIDWLVVDHYSLDDRWEEQMRPFTGNIMVVDDMANRPHDCDLLLDQNLYENLETRYDELVSDNCKRLLGPVYALLCPEFKAARASLRKRDGTIKRILVFFGGGDLSNETAKAIEAIRLLNQPNIAIDVIMGSANPHREQISRLCADMPSIRIHHQIDNMAQFMAQADLAIGAGGSTTWERCCLGLPSLTVAIAFNQEAIAEASCRAGAGVYLGLAQDISPAYIQGAIEKMLNDPDIMVDFSKKAMDLVDGEGITRVSHCLMDYSRQGEIS